MTIDPHGGDNWLYYRISPLWPQNPHQSFAVQVDYSRECYILYTYTTLFSSVLRACNCRSTHFHTGSAFRRGGAFHTSFISFGQCPVVLVSFTWVAMQILSGWNDCKCWTHLALYSFRIGQPTDGHSPGQRRFSGEYKYNCVSPNTAQIPDRVSRVKWDYQNVEGRDKVLRVKVIKDLLMNKLLWL